jgi:hypothetical protein
MAKKPMKFKRYEGGGEVEAADKAAGLKASKGEDVGFFKRLRMGNIDDPSSEAYKRFGAGRGRADRIPVEDRVATPVIQAAPKVEMDEMEAANARAPIPVPAGPRAEIKPAASKPAASKPAASKPASKPAEAKPKMEAVSKSSYDGPLRGMRSDTRSSGADKRGETDMSNYKPRRSSGSPSTDGRGETDMSNYKPRRSSGSPSTDTRGETDMSNYKPRRSSGSSSTDGRGETDMSNYKPRRSFDVSDTLDMTYKKGGAVSTASKRADGIASKGKTRGKMC